MLTLIVVADSATDKPVALNHDRHASQLKQRVTSSDVNDPRVAAQLLQRIGWALLDAEKAETDGTRRASCPRTPGRSSRGSSPTPVSPRRSRLKRRRGVFTARG